MALPAGITTCTVTFGPAYSYTGEEGVITGTVAADRNLIWAATGAPVFKVPATLVASMSGGQTSIVLPHTDQAGFLDVNGNAVTGWYYVATWVATFTGGRTESQTKRFQVLQGQSVVDIDLIPDGPVTPGVTVPVQYVTSVNGQTGAVVVDAGSSVSSQPGARVAFLGNSLMRGGDTEVTSDPLAGQVGLSWPRSAEQQSGGLVLLARNAGVSGDTAAQMLARFDTDITPSNPATVIIAAGLNDAFQAVPTATYIANIKALVAKVRSIGAAPILCTITPDSNAGTEQRRRIGHWNTWLALYAAAESIPLFDAAAAVTNPADGTLDATRYYDSGDGKHPNVIGQRALGAAFAQFFTGLVNPVPPPFATSNTDPSNLLTNGMFITDANSDGIAEGWGVNQTPGAGTFGRSLVTVAGVPGKAQRLTQTGATGPNALFQGVQAGASTFAPGDRLAATCLLTNTPNPIDGVLRAWLRIEAYTAGYAQSLGAAQHITDLALTKGLLRVDFTVPANCVWLNYIIRVENGTGTVDFMRATLTNLQDIS